VTDKTGGYANDSGAKINMQNRRFRAWGKVPLLAAPLA